MLIRNLFALSMMAVLVGCGGAKSGSDAQVTAPQIPTPVTIQSLHVLPGDVTLDLGQVAVLSAIATMSDNSQQAVAATWNSLNAQIASLSSLNGSTVTVTGLTQGSTTIEAAYSGFNASIDVTVTWEIPANAGPVYGSDSSLGMALCPANAPMQTVYSPYGPSVGFNPNGMAMDVAATKGYMIRNNGNVNYGPIGCQIHAVDLATNVGSVVATIAGDCQGLSTDLQGRVYTQSYNDGTIYRYDPATGQVTTVGNNGGGNLIMSNLADDSPCQVPLWAIQGSDPWISRTSPTGVVTPWAPCPAYFANGRYLVAGGLAVNRLGEVFVSTMSDPVVFRCRDINGDGDAMDANEIAQFADLPAHPAWPNGDQIVTYGLAATKGGGVLVNILDINGDGGWDPTIAAVAGLWWCVDRDGNGTAGLERHSDAYVYGGDGGCIATPR